MSNRGFTAVEMLISLLIISIISAVFYSQISLAFKSWDIKQNENEIVNEVRSTLAFIRTKTSGMDREHVLSISEPESTAGYIQFRDNIEGDIHTIIYNTDANQTALGLINTFSKNSIIYYIHVEATNTTTNEVIADDFAEMSFTLFASTGDMYPTVNVTDPGSLGIRVVKNKPSGTPVIMESLLDLRKDIFARSNSFAVGAGGIQYDVNQSGASIATQFYDDFSSANTLVNNWTLITVNNVAYTVAPVDNTLSLQQISFGVTGVDKLRYKPPGLNTKLSDVEYYFSADLSLQASTAECFGNRISLRLEDTSDPAGSYIDFVLESGWLRLYRYSGGTVVKVSERAIVLDSNKFYNLAIYNNKTSGKIEAYFNFEHIPFGTIANWTTNQGLYINVVHTRAYNNKKADARVRNFTVARTPVYNVNVLSDGLSMINPANYILPDSIAPERFFGLYQSPVFNVNNYLPAHFDRLVLNQNNAIATLKRTVLFLNIDNKGWVELTPSANSDYTYNISNLVGSTMQYRIEYRFAGDDPQSPDVSTININW